MVIEARTWQTSGTHPIGMLSLNLVNFLDISFHLQEGIVRHKVISYFSEINLHLDKGLKLFQFWQIFRILTRVHVNMYYRWVNSEGLL